MARPVYLFPVPGSFTATTDSSLVGAGTAYPLGLTLEQVVQLFYRVKSWSGVVDINADQNDPGLMSISGDIPLINGDTSLTDPLELSGVMYYDEIWQIAGTASEAVGCAQLPFYRFSIYNLTFRNGTVTSATYTPVESPTAYSSSDFPTINYTIDAASIEPMGDVSFVFGAYGYFYAGLYYPVIHISCAVSFMADYVHDMRIGPADPTWESVKSKGVIGNITINAPWGSTLTIPVNGYVWVDYAGEDFTSPAENADPVFNLELTPYKYWTYNDGTSDKYDEDTGALL